MARKERRPIAGRLIGASVTVPAISRSTRKEWARRCGALCSDSSIALASEASQADDDSAAFVPAICTLSWGHHTGPASCRSAGGELVHGIDSAGDSSRSGASTVGLNSAAYGYGASRLRDLAFVGTVRFAFRRSGISATR